VCAFIGAAEEGGKRLRYASIVALLPDAMLPCQPLDAVLVHDTHQLLKDEEQVTFEQAYWNSGADGSKDAEAGCIGDGLLLALLFLLGLPLLIVATGWLLRMMHWAGEYEFQRAGSSFAVARFKLLDEVVHGLLDEQLGGVVLSHGALLVRRVVAVVPLRRIFPVRRRVDVGCAIAEGVGLNGGGAEVLFHDSARSECGFARFRLLWTKKRHSFHRGETRHREALSIPEARRGVEANTAQVLRRAELHKRD
jgi:hypothetical protein